MLAVEDLLIDMIDKTIEYVNGRIDYESWVKKLRDDAGRLPSVFGGVRLFIKNPPLHLKVKQELDRKIKMIKRATKGRMILPGGVFNILVEALFTYRLHNLVKRISKTNVDISKCFKSFGGVSVILRRVAEQCDIPLSVSGVRREDGLYIVLEEGKEAPVINVDFILKLLDAISERLIEGVVLTYENYKSYEKKIWSRIPERWLTLIKERHEELYGDDDLRFVHIVSMFKKREGGYDIIFYRPKAIGRIPYHIFGRYLREFERHKASDLVYVEERFPEKGISFDYLLISAPEYSIEEYIPKKERVSVLFYAVNKALYIQCP